MLALVRRHALFFSIFAALGIALRLWLVFKFAVVDGDTLIYGNIALNWMQYGMFAISDGARVVPTMIRVPGYPAFLVACFRLFGAENYNAVMFVQCAVDLGTAFVLAAAALRICWCYGTQRIAMAVFAIYCLFPYTANMVSQPLAETLTLFVIAVWMYFCVRALADLSVNEASRDWIVVGVACALATLLRPDGGLLALTTVAFLIGSALLRLKSAPRRTNLRSAVRAAAVVCICTVVPLLPWAVRNHRVFHVVEAVAPFNATDPGDFFPSGFTRWTRTWLIEFASVVEIPWNVPGDEIEATKLPDRAFDSAEQKQRTLELIARYNEDHTVTPELDEAFARLAQERVEAHPLRYYLVLPAARVVDMWLRPRTDTFPIDYRWWQDPDWREFAFAIAYSGVGIVFLVAAGYVLIAMRHYLPAPVALFALYVVLRSIFLLGVPTAEPRYTIECWPMVLLFAGALASMVCVYSARLPQDRGPASNHAAQHGAT